MATARAEYARDVIEDALLVTEDPILIHAIVLNDSLNGIRKALLDLSEANRQIADEVHLLSHAVASE